MAGGKRPIVFLLGPSGAGKSTLASWLAEDAALLHLEIDRFPSNGIDAAGLRAEWNPFVSGASAGPLVAAIQSRVAAAQAAGAVLSFPSNLLLSSTHFSALRNAGVTSLVLYGSAADCLDAFLEQEGKLRRVNGDPVDHWIANNQHTYLAFSRPDFAALRLAAFRNDGRVSRADLVAEVQHRAAMNCACVSIEDVAHINASAKALRAPLSGMRRLTRWLGVLPLAAVGFMLPLLATWMVVDIVYLVAGRLSILLFTLAAAVLTLIGNGIAGYTAIAFGTAVAPRAPRKVGILLAVIYIIFTVVAVTLAWKRPNVGTRNISIVYLVANPAGLWWWWLVFAAVISVMAALAAAVRRSR